MIQRIVRVFGFVTSIVLFSAALIVAGKQVSTTLGQSTAPASRVDGSIISKVPFIPHKFTELHPDNQINKKFYDGIAAHYHQVPDAEFFTIRYMSDGLEVVGILAQPKQLVPEKKYPVIIYNRGGVFESGKITVCTIEYDIYYLVQAGYVVLASQYRGNDGSQGHDELGGSDVADVVNLVKTAQTLPYADPKNLFMIGRSRGGMMTYQALKQGVQVNAVAILAGMADLFSFARNCPQLLEAALSKIASNRFLDRSQEFTKRSAVCWADQLNAPMLIFHGHQDEFLNVSEAISLTQKLKQYKKTYDFVLLPEGDHTLIGYEDMVQRRILSWFDQYKK